MSCLDYDDLIEYSPHYYESDENIDGEALACSKCKMFFDTQRKLRCHTAVVHNGWPLVLHEGVDETEVPVKVVYVCSLCFGQYEVVEDLRRHMKELHKYQSAEENQEQQVLTYPIKSDEFPDSAKEHLKKISESTASQNATENSTCLTVPISVSALPIDDANLEMRPLPFKNFRLLLRSKMHLRLVLLYTIVFNLMKHLTFKICITKITR